MNHKAIHDLSEILGETDEYPATAEELDAYGINLDHVPYDHDPGFYDGNVLRSPGFDPDFIRDRARGK